MNHNIVEGLNIFRNENFKLINFDKNDKFQKYNFIIENGSIIPYIIVFKFESNIIEGNIGYAICEISTTNNSKTLRRVNKQYLKNNFIKYNFNKITLKNLIRIFSNSETGKEMLNEILLKYKLDSILND